MNGLQIYILGCLIAYPIAIYILKILNEPNEIGLFEKSQKILQELNFYRSVKFYYNITLFILILMSWITILIQIYFYIKVLINILKYYLFRK
jgi:hypothetical protein